MAQVTVERAISAPPERVFAILSDVEGAPQHQPEIVRIEMLTTGPVGKGTRWNEVRKMGGKEAALILEITQFDPPRSYTVESRSMGIHFVTRLEVNPHPSGALAAMHMEAKASNPLSWIMMSLMMPMVRKGLESDLTALGSAASS